MKRFLVFGYALLAYLAALLSLTFLIFWVFPWPFMPWNIDRGTAGGYAAVIDITLILLFGLQHSLMAREGFKQKLFGTTPPAVRDATYTLFSAFALVVLYRFWQPVGGTLWAFEDGIGRWGLTLLYAAGWLFAFVATFQIDHFELFGLHQGYRYLRGIPEPRQTFRKKGFYRYLRHPIQAGTLVGIWATPVMSYGHLLFAVGMTFYILIGLYFEERSLARSLGKAYETYKKEVPMLMPFGKSRDRKQTVSTVRKKRNSRY